MSLVISKSYTSKCAKWLSCHFKGNDVRLRQFFSAGGRRGDSAPLGMTFHVKLSDITFLLISFF